MYFLPTSLFPIMTSWPYYINKSVIWITMCMCLMIHQSIWSSCYAFFHKVFACFISKSMEEILIKYDNWGLHWKLFGEFNFDLHWFQYIPYFTWSPKQTINILKYASSYSKIGTWQKVYIFNSYNFYFKHFLMWWIFNETEGKTVSGSVKCSIYSVISPVVLRVMTPRELQMGTNILEEHTASILSPVCSSKMPVLTSPHGMTTQKMTMDIFTAVGTPNLFATTDLYLQ
jgi:hypothetical protein